MDNVDVTREISDLEHSMNLDIIFTAVLTWGKENVKLKTDLRRLEAENANLKRRLNDSLRVILNYGTHGASPDTVSKLHHVLDILEEFPNISSLSLREKTEKAENPQ